MSRIGRLPVSLPKGVTFEFAESSHKVTVKGPKGELHQTLDPDFKVTVEGNDITVHRPTEQKRHKAMHGLYRALIQNTVTGVHQGFEKRLELSGVGYQCVIKGMKLELSVGYSKPVTPLAQAVRDYVVGYLAPGKRLGDGLLEPRRD